MGALRKETGMKPGYEGWPLIMGDREYRLFVVIPEDNRAIAG